MTLSKFFQSKNGQVAIWQWPNIPIVAWALFAVASRLLGSEPARAGAAELSRAFLFVWAYLEIIQGASPFRKALGLVVLAATIFSIYA